MCTRSERVPTDLRSRRTRSTRHIADVQRPPSLVRNALQPCGSWLAIRRLFLGMLPWRKHELSKIDFELIDDAFKALLQSKPDPAVADKVADLRDKFRDGFTGWLEIEQAA
jgi:hypothetical protein